jgi:hypothetical protein
LPNAGAVKANPWIVKTLQKVPKVVLAVVGYDIELELLRGLIEDALNSLSQVGLKAMHRHEKAEPGRVVGVAGDVCIH